MPRARRASQRTAQSLAEIQQYHPRRHIHAGLAQRSRIPGPYAIQFFSLRPLNVFSVRDIPGEQRHCCLTPSYRPIGFAPPAPRRRFSVIVATRCAIRERHQRMSARRSAHGRRSASTSRDLVIISSIRKRPARITLLRQLSSPGAGSRGGIKAVPAPSQAHETELKC